MYAITKFKLWQPKVLTNRYISDFRLYVTNDANEKDTVLYYPIGVVDDPPQTFDELRGRMPDEPEYTTFKFSDHHTQVEWTYANNSGVHRTTTHLGGESDPTFGINRSSTVGYHQFKFDNYPTRQVGRYLYFEGEALFTSERHNVRLFEIEVYGKKLS